MYCKQFAINAGIFTVSEQPAGSYMLKYPLIREAWSMYEHKFGSVIQNLVKC